MEGEEVVRIFQERVENFVTESLSGYQPARHAREKSIRDAIWGTTTFYPWEIAIVDSPLLQRLRDIRQTGLAYLVYPTAVHSRFDHTLGVVAVASKIVRSINDKYPQDRDLMISYNEHMRVRLSAILHDVGHSCLSHVSETVYGNLPEFRELTLFVNAEFGVTPKPHEVVSWLVVRSQAFREFMVRIRSEGCLPPRVCSDEDIEAIALNIIGYRKDPREKFIADIINGPMDADKLDYLVRDAYFAGPTVVYDLERFLHTVDLFEYPRAPSVSAQGANVWRLSVPIEGVTALEQIIISKLMLFSYLYHHHKIRCVEGMFHECLLRLIEIGQAGQGSRGFPCIDHAASFVQLSDRFWMPEAWPPELQGDKLACEILGMLARRELYKRALVVSRLFIRDIDMEDSVRVGFDRLLECGRDEAKRVALRDKIFGQAKKKTESRKYRDSTTELRKRFKPHRVLVDIPISPIVEEVVGVMVPLSRDTGRSEAQYAPLSNVFPIEKWVDAYNAIKWRGHVFALDEAAPFVNAAAIEVLAEEPYSLKFDPPATSLCKLARIVPPDLRLT